MRGSTWSAGGVGLAFALACGGTPPGLPEEAPAPVEPAPEAEAPPPPRAFGPLEGFIAWLAPDVAGDCAVNVMSLLDRKTREQVKLPPHDGSTACPRAEVVTVAARPGEVAAYAIAGDGLAVEVDSARWAARALPPAPAEVSIQALGYDAEGRIVAFGEIASREGGTVGGPGPDEHVLAFASEALPIDEDRAEGAVEMLVALMVTETAEGWISTGSPEILYVAEGEPFPHVVRIQAPTAVAMPAVVSRTRQSMPGEFTLAGDTPALDALGREGGAWWTWSGPVRLAHYRLATQGDDQPTAPVYLERDGAFTALPGFVDGETLAWDLREWALLTCTPSGSQLHDLRTGELVWQEPGTCAWFWDAAVG